MAVCICGGIIAVDFIAGGTYGLGGNQERVGESVFFFAPRNMEVSAGDLEQDSSSNSTSNTKTLAEGQGEMVDFNKRSANDSSSIYERIRAVVLGKEDESFESSGETVITPTSAPESDPPIQALSDENANLGDVAL
jgi:hypothetical protein